MPDEIRDQWQQRFDRLEESIVKANEAAERRSEKYDELFSKLREQDVVLAKELRENDGHSKAHLSWMKPLILALLSATLISGVAAYRSHIDLGVKIGSLESTVVSQGESLKSIPSEVGKTVDKHAIQLADAAKAITELQVKLAEAAKVVDTLSKIASKNDQQIQAMEASNAELNSAVANISKRMQELGDLKSLSDRITSATNQAATATTDAAIASKRAKEAAERGEEISRETSSLVERLRLMDKNPSPITFHVRLDKNSLDGNSSAYSAGFLVSVSPPIPLTKDNVQSVAVEIADIIDPKDPNASLAFNLSCMGSLVAADKIQVDLGQLAEDQTPIADFVRSGGLLRGTVTINYLKGDD